MTDLLVPSFEERLRQQGHVYFYRGMTACAITLPPSGLYWGHVGFPQNDAHYGCRYLVVGPTRLHKVSMPLAGIRGLDTRWWLGFEGGSPLSLTKTRHEVQAVVDALYPPSVAPIWPSPKKVASP